MKKVSRNVLSIFFSDGVTRIIGFVATVYIARVLVVEGFGLINYGLAFISYALLFANPGLTIIGAREVDVDRLVERVRRAFVIGPERVEPPRLILGTVDEIDVDR